MRVDVHLLEQTLESELTALHARLAPTGLFSQTPGLPTGVPNVRAFTRVCDGEHFVYLVDTAAGRLAGTTVFSRLVELPKRADRHFRSPHSRYHPDYRRLGLASWAYRQVLEDGMCLMSGARQSAGAHALWMKLARDHRLRLADVADRRVHLREPDLLHTVPDDLATRMVLLGRGWSAERLHRHAGVSLEEDVLAAA